MRVATPFVALLLVTAFAIGGLSTAVAAESGDTDVEQVGNIDASIEDESYHIDGATITGDSLPSMTIDERTYEIDSFSLQTDGLTVEYNGTEYYVCQLDISVENVELTISDISIGNGE